MKVFQSGELTTNTWVTFQEIGIGFPIGALTGIWTGYLFGRSKALADIFEPIIMALYGVPRTALAPLFIVWLGIGIWSKVGVVFILVFFLNFFNTYAGMKQLDQEFVDLARLMGANRWRLSFRVILPAVSPYIITGIQNQHSVLGHRRHHRRIHRRHRRSGLLHPRRRRRFQNRRCVCRHCRIDDNRDSNE